MTRGSGTSAFSWPVLAGNDRQLCHVWKSARSQGSGVGSELLLHALRQIAAASRHVGFEVVVVHAIDKDAVTFYAQRGFTRFEDHDLHLFMPVNNLLATLEAHYG